MRELITIEFIDKSSYSDNTTSDVIGLVMPHVWGPVDKLTPVEYSKFMQNWPELNSPGWIKASQAFQAGAGMCEILRPQLGAEYQMYVVTDTGFQTVTGAKQFTVSDSDLSGAKNLAVFSLLYPGSPKGKVDSVEIELSPVYEDSVTEPTPADVPIDVQATVTLYDANGNTVEGPHEGLMISQEIIDGVSVNIGDVLRKKSYYIRYQLNDSEGLITREQLVEDPNPQPSNNYVEQTPDVKVPVIGETAGEGVDVTISQLVELYTRWFSHMETSQATILLPTVCDATLINAVTQIAAQRSECMAFHGYPTDAEFTEDAIKTFFQKLTMDKFAAFWAGRDVVTIGGKEVPGDCIGTIAGRYAAVAQSDTINQPASAQSFGAYPGSLLESLDTTAVLALQKLGINSVYSAYTGPQIWGIKTMYSRQSSYWAKVNVMRVTTQLLSTTMDYIMQVFHTPNTTAKKAMVQQNRQAYIDSLISQDVLKSQSSCQCDDENNKDIDTNGGEILIIDFDLWYVKVIEKVHIRIEASDDSTQITIS